MTINEMIRDLSTKGPSFLRRFPSWRMRDDGDRAPETNRNHSPGDQRTAGGDSNDTPRRGYGWQQGAATSRGLVRDENQDHYTGVQLPIGVREAQLYVVADGMGGVQGGALAAELTVRGLDANLRSASTDAGEGAVEEIIRQAFSVTNKTVYERGHSGEQSTAGMGSTAVLALLLDRKVFIAHVGDSRAYLFRRQRLERLTSDHTLVQRWVDAEQLTEVEARTHPEASTLTRAIGNKPDILVDIRQLQIEEEDGLLLCSDGLSGYVDDESINDILVAAERDGANAQSTTERLIEAALAQGGEDNVTVQYLRFIATEDRDRADSARHTKEDAVFVAPHGERPSSSIQSMVVGLVTGLVVGAVLTGLALNAFSAQRSEEERRADKEELLQQIQKIESKLEEGPDLAKRIAERLVASASPEETAEESPGSRSVEKIVALLEDALDDLQKEDKKTLETRINEIEKLDKSTSSLLKGVDEQIAKLNSRKKTIEGDIEGLRFKKDLIRSVLDNAVNGAIREQTARLENMKRELDAVKREVSVLGGKGETGGTGASVDHDDPEKGSSALESANRTRR